MLITDNYLTMGLQLLGPWDHQVEGRHSLGLTVLCSLLERSQEVDQLGQEVLIDGGQTMQLLWLVLADDLLQVSHGFLHRHKHVEDGVPSEMIKRQANIVLAIGIQDNLYYRLLTHLNYIHPPLQRVISREQSGSFT